MTKMYLRGFKYNVFVNRLLNQLNTSLCKKLKPGLIIIMIIGIITGIIILYIIIYYISHLCLNIIKRAGHADRHKDLFLFFLHT